MRFEEIGMKRIPHRSRFSLGPASVRYAALHWYVVCAAATLWISTATTAEAQTRFLWPESTGWSGASYEGIAECLAMARRTRDSVGAMDGVMRDTMPFDVAELLAPVPPAVVERVRGCGVRQRVPVVPFDATMPMHIEFLLIAGLDDEVEHAIQRRLAAIPDTGRAELDSVLVVMTQLYLAARPVRLAAADRLISTLLRPGGRVSPVLRMGLLHDLHRTAVTANDTALATATAKRFLTMSETLSAADRGNEKVAQIMQWLGRQGEQYLRWSQVAASLRHGVDSFFVLQRTIQEAVRRELNLPAGTPPLFWEEGVGKSMPPIPGDYWFPEGTGKATYPVPGRITVVLFAGPSDFWWTGGVVRRL